MNFRLGPCTSCHKQGRSVPAKYRCPACNVVSCSLPCVLSHKLTNNCDGIRDRAAHVRKLDYNDSHFISDYTLLEETSRAVASATRTRSSLTPSYDLFIKKPNPPGAISKGRMSMLSREASKRNINLRFMPKPFARHARNSSHARSVMEPDPEDATHHSKKRDRRDRILFWHLDVYFAACAPHPESKLVKVEACAEDQQIAAVLQGAVSALNKGRKRRRVDSTGRVANRDFYAKYITADVQDISLFLRNEHVLSVPNADSPPSHQAPQQKKLSAQNQLDLHRYIPLDTASTLKDALSGKSIVEFPIFHVAIKGSDQEKALATATSGLFEKPDADYDSSDSDSSCPSSLSLQHSSIPKAANGVIVDVSEPINTSSHDPDLKKPTVIETLQSHPKITAVAQSTTDAQSSTVDLVSTSDDHAPVTVIPPKLAIPRRSPMESNTTAFPEPRIPRKSLDAKPDAPLNPSTMNSAKLAASS